MNKKEERHSQITAFIESNGELSSWEILSFLGEENIDKRTLQRDLKELIEKKLISQSGTARSTVYYSSKNYKIFEEINVEAYFEEDYQKREVQEGFHFEIFDTLAEGIFTNEEREYLESLQSEFIRNIWVYDSQTLINKEYERIMIEFSWKSSAIEWNTYSLLNTEALIKENVKDESKTDEETQMILNHKDAFNESIQNKQSFIQTQTKDLEYIHSVLTKKLDVAKNIRKHGVGITGTRYKPLDNEFQIREALDACITLINKKDSVFEKAFIALILLSYIQAFEDGNKRTARIFSNAILLAHNSIPLSYRIVDIIEYKKASLLFYEQNNISYFKRIFIEQFEDAVRNYFK